MRDRVLLLTQTVALGGLERMVFNLARAQRARGRWAPHVFVYEHPHLAKPGTHLLPSFKEERIPIETYSKGPGVSLRAAAKIAVAARKKRIGVIHSHDLGALVYGVGAKLLTGGRLRLVHTQHSFVHLDRNWRYRHYERFLTRFVDELVTVSDDTRREYLALGLSPSRIKVIPNGISFADRTGSSPAAQAALKARLLPRRSDATWLLYLARIHGRKGQDHAIRLWESLPPQSRAKCALIFVGAETEPGRLRKLRLLIRRASDRDRIHLIGPAVDPTPWLQAADVFVSCSEYEGMPLAPLEAAGAGMPLVLSRIPGHEIFAKHSFQYSLEQPEEGVRAIEKAIAVSKSSGGRAALSRYARDVRDRFSLDVMAERYEALYSQERRKSSGVGRATRAPKNAR